MRQCFFCDNPADSLEHLWPQWILERVKPRGPMRHVIAGAVRSMGKPEIKMKCVCSGCNNGWMHDLEQRSIPVLGAMLHDIATPLDAEQQITLALWSVKTAIVLEATKRPEERRFTQAERVELRKQFLIPSRTAMWLGRYTSSGVGAFGTDLGFDIENFGRAAVGCVTTIIVGHLALQVLALRAVEQLNGQTIRATHAAGPWEELLVQVWPVQARAQWPPKLSFTNSGELSLSILMDRWRIGQKVAKLDKFGPDVPNLERPPHKNRRPGHRQRTCAASKIEYI